MTGCTLYLGIVGQSMLGALLLARGEHLAGLLALGGAAALWRFRRRLYARVIL